METTSFDLQDEFGPDVTLESVEIRERTISALHSSYGNDRRKGPMKLGKHDYIVLTAINKDYTRLSFVVEKIRNWTHCGGIRSHIHMVPLSDYSPSAWKYRSRFVWKPHKPRIMSTTELNTILTTGGDHYNLFSANCWNNATDRVDDVLNLCLRHSRRMGDFRAARGCLEALRQLEAVTRSLPRDVLRLFYKPLSRKNLGTWSRIFKRWERRFNMFASM